MPAARSHLISPPRSHRPSRLAQLTCGVRDVGRRRRTPLTVAGSLATAAILVFVLAGRRHEFAAAISSAAVWVLVVSALLQIVALVSRSEAWHLTIQAAGGTVDLRVLYRASSVQTLGSVLNGHLGVAARIAVLRRSSPTVSPQVPTLIAAEFPILAVEAALAALLSFTLIGPLGLAWWAPVVGIAVIAIASAGLRHLAVRKGRELWKGSRFCAACGVEAACSASLWLPCSRRSCAIGCCCTRSASTLLPRRDRRADRGRDAQPASGGTGRRGGRRGPDPRQPGGRGDCGRRSPAHRDGHHGRPVLRGVGRSRSTCGGTAGEP